MNINELENMIAITETRYGKDDELVKFYKNKKEELKKQIEINIKNRLFN